MTTLTYAGIGARATPPSILTAMTVMAGWLGRQGWHLNSGGAAGADSAFAEGAPAGQRTLYLPWSGYNGRAGPDCQVLSPSELESCMAIAARLHPAWDRCSPAVRKLHARNAAIVGVGLGRPVDAWWPGHRGERSPEAPGWPSALPPRPAFPCSTWAPCLRARSASASWPSVGPDPLHRAGERRPPGEGPVGGREVVSLTRSGQGRQPRRTQTCPASTSTSRRP